MQSMEEIPWNIECSGFLVVEKKSRRTCMCMEFGLTRGEISTGRETAVPCNDSRQGLSIRGQNTCLKCKVCLSNGK